MFQISSGAEALCSRLPIRGSNHLGGALSSRQAGARGVLSHPSQTRTDSEPQHFNDAPGFRSWVTPWVCQDKVLIIRGPPLVYSGCRAGRPGTGTFPHPPWGLFQLQLAAHSSGPFLTTVRCPPAVELWLWPASQRLERPQQTVT